MRAVNLANHTKIILHENTFIKQITALECSNCVRVCVRASASIYIGLAKGDNSLTFSGLNV